MMPDMDGIETTAAIRELEKKYQGSEKSMEQIPIIALTANAVVGMREMFIEKDFSDFLAKPIDVSKLDEILDRWIPENKRDEGREKEELEMRNEELGIENKDANSSFLTPNSSLLSIPGIDAQKGIAMTGGTVSAYLQVLSLFRKDAQDRLPLLQNPPLADALPAFVTQVHALKSASASLGAVEIAAKAADLEKAGKAVDLAFIHENLPAFAQQLAKLVRAIEKALETSEAEKQKPLDSSFLIAHSSLLEELAGALKAQKSADIDRILDELMRQPMDPGVKAALEEISDEVLMTEFEKALKIAGSLLARKEETGAIK